MVWVGLGKRSCTQVPIFAESLLPHVSCAAHVILISYVLHFLKNNSAASWARCCCALTPTGSAQGDGDHCRASALRIISP